MIIQKLSIFVAFEDEQAQICAEGCEGDNITCVFCFRFKTFMSYPSLHSKTNQDFDQG